MDLPIYANIRLAVFFFYLVKCLLWYSEAESKGMENMPVCYHTYHRCVIRHSRYSSQSGAMLVVALNINTY